MKYNVKEVEFEFCLDYAKLTFDEQIEIRDLALGVWEADDEDDLLEEITASTGWLIESIDYDIQLKQWHTTHTIGHGMDYNKYITKENPQMIKIGTEVQSKTHDDLNGTVVLLDRSSNMAVVKTYIEEYECMTVETYLSDLEVVQYEKHSLTTSRGQYSYWRSIST